MACWVSFSYTKNAFGGVNVTDLVVATLSGPKVMGWLQECVPVELLVKSENAFVDGC